MVIGVDADPAAMRSASSAIWAASSAEWAHSARAAARAKGRRSDADEAVVGLDHVARARDDEGRLRVGHGEQRLQPPEHPVHPPVLGQLDRRPREIAAMLLELGLELGEERERVSRRAREAREHAIVVDLPDLSRPGLHDRLADRDLAVPGQRHLPAMADAGHRRRVKPAALAHHRIRQVARGWAASYTFMRCSGLTCV